VEGIIINKANKREKDDGSMEITKLLTKKVMP